MTHAPANSPLPTERRYARLCCLAIGVLYGIAFCLPAIDFGTPGNPHASAKPGGVAYGINLFLIGWLWPSAWIANPLLCVGTGFLARGWWRTATVLGAVALLGGLTAVVWVTGDEKAGLLPGYYAWMASMALLAVSGLVLWIRSRSRDRTAMKG